MSEKSRFEPQRFVFETPLYEVVELPSVDFSNFVAMFHSKKSTIDGYCVDCGRESVFHSHSRFGIDRAIGSLKGKSEMTFLCQRNPSHVLTVFTELKIEDDFGVLKAGKVQKIGQWPTHADIANAGLKKFSSVLKGKDRREFGTANGLAAHGSNIGAFVYLRRLFERLVLRAQERKNGDLNPNSFSQLRMDEKISALADELPEFMVKNRRVYSVLSKGIHELEEDECGSYYELLRSSILLMLEQEKEFKEKARQEAELAELLAKIDIKDKK